MLKAEVAVGKVYLARVSDKVVPVRIEREAGRGYEGVNLASKRTVYLKSAAKLRREATVDEIDRFTKPPLAVKAENIDDLWLAACQGIGELEPLATSRDLDGLMKQMQVVWRTLSKIRVQSGIPSVNQGR